mmetsp:Transcript_918/g.1697  ORF Transcript_918/g.1697 Transcript_918/m.1697 type:complete len:83 (-) Transcript_918:1032-1280(-)
MLTPRDQVPKMQGNEIFPQQLWNEFSMHCNIKLSDVFKEVVVILLVKKFLRDIIVCKHENLKIIGLILSSSSHQCCCKSWNS